MKHLYLLRHAKSSWDNPNLPDHDRPLDRRGEQAGAAMAAIVAALTPGPDVIVCSTAVRAQGTLDLVRPSLPDVPVRLDPILYTFDVPPLRLHLEGLNEDISSVLVIGHNPALELLARSLAAADRHPPMERLRRKFPTAALAELDLPIAAWAALGDVLDNGGARLRRFTRPADLARG